jgi:hypothetical protein
MKLAFTSKLLIATAFVGLSTSVPVALAQEDKGAKAIVVCSAAGGVEDMASITQNVPTSTASAALVAIPDTTVAAGASGAAGDFDTYVVTFGGEASATSGGVWIAQAQIQIGAGAFVAMNPSGPNTFHKGNKAESNSMTWCSRINSGGAGVNVRIVWSKSGGGTAILDDYITMVTRFN